jgi:glutamate synthase domain-containing protein 2
VRTVFVFSSLGVILTILALSLVSREALWLFVFAAPLIGMGVYDMLQTSHSIRRNFPLLGRMRYLFESIRPEIHQYFVESNSSGRPFSRQERSLVYQRAKNVNDTLPFGTELDVYQVGYEWMNHSLAAKPAAHDPPRIRVGGPDTKKPYHAAILNVSGMSYGALSPNAIRALNKGAKLGGFAHNTGEGGISPYHREHGGDLIWQVGTGYFGCRNARGEFDRGAFKAASVDDQIKMIEIKLSQGAKPGHGGILPKHKVTAEIARIRLVPMGADVISPPTHSAFGTPIELCEFIAELRELSGGKPVGFKLCIGKRREFLALCKAMHETRIMPDFITVDGGEGGTGAAPLEFTNVLGTPLVEALIFVHNALVGTNLREHVKVLASGRLMTGFDLAKRIALGADICMSARAMMFALGCIQAQQCNTNLCPTGVATQRPDLVKGLDVSDKAVRVCNFQRNTVHAFAELMAAAGLTQPSELRPWHILRRIAPNTVQHYGEIYEYLSPGALLSDRAPASFARAWAAASAEGFDHNAEDEGSTARRLSKFLPPRAVS